MPTGIYKRIKSHKKILSQNGLKGRFKEGHLFIKGGEKDWIRKLKDEEYLFRNN